MPYYRRNIYVLCAAMFLAAVSWNQIIPFLPAYLKELGAGPHLYAWVGAVFAVQSVAAMLAQPVWGKLGDSYGRKTMILRAGVCLAGIYFGMSFCTQPWQLLLCRFLNGALTGFIPGSFTLIATNTPEQLAPSYIATAQTMTNVGLIVGPALGGLLLRFGGYRDSMRISGFAVLACTLLVWWLVEEPNKSAQTEKTNLLHDIKMGFRSNVLVSIMLASVLGSFVSSAISPFLKLHFGGVQDWLIGILFALPAASFVLSARTWSRTGERYGYHRTITWGLVATIVGCVVLALAHSVWTFAFIFFLTGIGLAAVSPSVGALICTRIPEDFRGRAYGMQGSASTFGGLIAPLAAGWASATFGTNSIFLLVAGTLSAGLLLLRVLFGRWKPEAE